MKGIKGEREERKRGREIGRGERGKGIKGERWRIERGG